MVLGGWGGLGFEVIWVKNGENREYVIAVSGMVWNEFAH